MTQRLLLIAVVVTLLLATAWPGLAALASSDGNANPLGLVYADGGEPVPTPTATPALPDGSCQGGGQCGG